MHPRRLTRLNELIQQTVSQAVLNLKDPELGFVTITGAETTSDVSLTRVFYSVYGDEEQRKATQVALDRARSAIRRQVGRLENLRRVPDIAFIYDQSVENADRVARLINKIHEEKNNDSTNS